MKIALRGFVQVFLVLSMVLLYSISTSQAGGNLTPGKDSGNITSITSNIIQGNQSRIDGNNPINGYDLSDRSYNIRVVLDHIFISKKNNSLEITDIVVFRNEGPEIYYSKDNHTFFAISTPPGVKNLKTEAMECCLVEEEGAVFMDPMQSIKPGDNFEMQVSYTIFPQGREYVFNKSAMYNTTSLSVFIDKKSGIDLEGIYETLTLHGNEYNVIAFNDLIAGETVGVPIKLTEKPDFLYAALGLFFLVSIGLVYRFRGMIVRRGKEDTLEELELEKKKIFQAIRGFEKHAGTENSEEYRRLMDEYRQKGIQILIKIDKVKADRNRDPEDAIELP